MIKMNPVLIEFGDGDTGMRWGITEENGGCMALYNGEPGEIGREITEEFFERGPEAYIVFKNVKSLDYVIGNLQNLRDLMLKQEGQEEATDDDL